MSEVFHIAFSGANIIYTALLIVVLIYWLTVILGALDLDFLDFDLDTDVDLDVDVDVDVEVDVDAEMDTDVGGGIGGWFTTVAGFFNLGAVPFMIFVSFLVLSLWVFGVLSDSWFSESYPWFPAAFIVPNLILSLFMTRLLTTPFKSSYRKMNRQGISKRQLVGKLCEVTVGVSSGKIGQAQLTFDDQHFLLHVFAKPEETIHKGEKALIVEYDPEKDRFLITHFDV